MSKNYVPRAKIKPKKRMRAKWKSSRSLTTSPTLRFSPTAWAKLLFLRDYGDTEVGGFGISPEDDLLFIQDVQLVAQVCSWAHVAFDDTSVADFFDSQVDVGRSPEQFARIWVHTHPGDCPLPSGTDEESFARVFGRSNWAVMFILARGGQSFARLRFNNGPGADLNLPVEIDYGRAFPACQPDVWEQEYLAHILPQLPVPMISRTGKLDRAPLLEEELSALEIEPWFDESGLGDFQKGVEEWPRATEF